MCIAITISGDGTTHKHINHESKHITLTTSGTDEEAIVTTLFAGINTAPNHTSAEQFEGWMALIKELSEIYKESELGAGQDFEEHHFASRLKGLLTDHAPDQLLLRQLLCEWKEYCDRVTRGDSVLLASDTDIISILIEANNVKVAEAGGQDAWDQLSVEAKAEQNTATYNRVRRDLGDKAFDALSDAEKCEVNFLVWSGCCMHKEMNAAKGGNAEMQAYWAGAGLEPPKLLKNRDNAAAAQLGGSAARRRANDVSQGGGVKTTSLAGAIFNNKDDKKGQQDTFRWFFERKLGYIVTFPGTSAIRYGSHCEAAGVLIRYLPLFLEFLELVRSKKDSGTLNHMENNVYNALRDIPTITELCVLALYAQAVSHPYMRVVRGADGIEKNALDLGPLHDKVRTHCERIGGNPDLLLAPDATHEEGSLDGEMWHRPDIVYSIRGLMHQLPHIRGATSAFFRGAGKTWPRFSQEFDPRGMIALLSAEERKRAFMNATNDHNEGALGAYRVGVRHAPSMTLAQWNARALYKRNQTRRWMKLNLTSKHLRFLRRAARKLDASKLEKERRQAQAEADARAAAKKQLVEAARKKRRDAARALVEAVEPVVDLGQLQQIPCKLTVKELDLQLKWHRAHGVVAIPMQKDMKVKADKVAALIVAVEAYNEREVDKGEEDAESFVDTSSDSGDETDAELY